MTPRQRIARALVGVCAIGLIVASFLDWYTANIDATDAFIMEPDGTLRDLGTGEVPVDGWHLDAWYLWTLPPVVVAGAMLAVVGTRIVAPRTRLARASIDLGALGLLAAAFVVIKFVVGEDIAENNMFEVTVGRSPGMYLALAAGIGLTVGGFLDPYTRRGAPAGDPTATE
jgi:hypothetical protein